MPHERIFVIPTQESVKAFWSWAAFLVALFGIIYGFSNHFAAQNPRLYHMYTEWELTIPLVPEMITVYLSYVAAFLMLLFVMKSTEAIRCLAYGFLVGLLIAGVVFLLFPGHLGMPALNMYLNTISFSSIYIWLTGPTISFLRCI